MIITDLKHRLYIMKDTQLLRISTLAYTKDWVFVGEVREALRNDLIKKYYDREVLALDSQYDEDDECFYKDIYIDGYVIM